MQMTSRHVVNMYYKGFNTPTNHHQSSLSPSYQSIIHINTSNVLFYNSPHAIELGEAGGLVTQ